jgi:hypothetical protein
MNIPSGQQTSGFQAGLDGYRRATRRMDTAAAQIASPHGDAMDPAPMVELRTAEHQARASLAVIRSAHRMQESMLDILA